jgi:hypothetical protein
METPELKLVQVNLAELDKFLESKNTVTFLIKSGE